MTCPRVCVCGCVCEIRDAESDHEIPACRGWNRDQTTLRRLLSDAERCNALETNEMKGAVLEVSGAGVPGEGTSCKEEVSRHLAADLRAERRLRHDIHLTATFFFEALR
jgi:hypothetical protein